MEKIVIVHYHEIGLKGKNRNFFEKKLVSNIQKALASLDKFSVKRISGRIIVKYDSKKVSFSKIKTRLKKVFGIAYFADAWPSSQDLEVLQKNVLKLISDKVALIQNRRQQGHHSKVSILDQTQEISQKNKRIFRRFAPSQDDAFKFTFKIETQRSKKTYPLTSPEINQKIGTFVLKNLKDVKVDLEKPDLTCFIEIVEKYAFIYFKKENGLGGLPVGVSGQVVSLISSGFDSPVASFKIMKRGVKVIFCHFHSYPQTNLESIVNVKKLVKILNQYQFSSSLYLIPFLEIQKEIVKKCHSDFYVVLYRRMMVRIGEKIAEKEKAKALITGDSLGQVASQTLENISVINQAIKLPILRPLIEFDKQEIISWAKKISTYKVSSQPYQDCCSLFIPRHPATKAKLADILKEEKKLDIEKLIKIALSKIELIKIKN